MFHFEAHDIPKLKTVEDYKNFLKKGYIYDEYGRSYAENFFWSYIGDSKLPDENGDFPYSFDNLPEEEKHISNIGSWMNEGYMFSTGDFC